MDPTAQRKCCKNKLLWQKKKKLCFHYATDRPVSGKQKHQFISLLEIQLGYKYYKFCHPYVKHQTFVCHCYVVITAVEKDGLRRDYLIFCLWSFKKKIIAILCFMAYLASVFLIFLGIPRGHHTGLNLKLFWKSNNQNFWKYIYN